MFEYDIGSFVATILLLSNVFSKLIGRCMEVKDVLIISVLFVCNCARVDKWFNVELLIAVVYGLLCPYLIKISSMVVINYIVCTLTAFLYEILRSDFY